jgi:preprotein translocase subunit SecB
LLDKGDVDLRESNFQLSGRPQITKITYETNKDYVFDEQIILEIMNDVKIDKNIDDTINDATVYLDIRIFPSKDISEVPFKMNISIEGYFNWDDELAKNQTQLDTMLKQNAPAVLYSYLRPIITLITVEANMPPLVLPLMNFCE